MTAKTARDVVRYITQTSQPESDIFIGWFGGEPTYNMEVMDIITQGVIASGRRVHSSMISNGYLFSKEVCEKAVNDWFLQHVQITLDGTEEIISAASCTTNCLAPIAKVLNDNHELNLLNAVNLLIKDSHGIDANITNKPKISNNIPAKTELLFSVTFI